MKGKLKFCTFEIYFIHDINICISHIIHIGADILLQDVRYLMIRHYKKIRPAGSSYLNTCVDKSSCFGDCEFDLFRLIELLFLYKLEVR
jgi:hypothetical protein